MLSCLAVRYGGQRNALTKPSWVQIVTSVSHQDPKKQNVSFKIIAIFTEVSELHQFSPGFHQVFTMFSPGFTSSSLHQAKSGKKAAGFRRSVFPFHVIAKNVRSVLSVLPKAQTASVEPNIGGPLESSP